MTSASNHSSNQASNHAAILRTREWFEHHSGWAPPDVDTIAEWLADDFCRAPDDCVVAPDGCCEHGLASWRLIIEAEHTG